MKLYWNIHAPGEDSGGSMKNPLPDDVMERLDGMERHAGVVGLDDPATSSNLQVRGERQTYLLTLGCEEEDDYDVKTPYCATTAPDMIPVLGDLYDARTLTADFGLVRAVFRLFLAGERNPDGMV
ncbi:DUF6911 family protein [Komagataeibacter melomenusus]